MENVSKLSRSKPVYISQNDDGIEEIKQELNSKVSMITKRKMSNDDLIELCNNLSDIVQNQASELVDLYHYSKSSFSQTIPHQNDIFSYQKPLINIYILSPPKQPQNLSQFINPMQQITNPYLYNNVNQPQPIQVLPSYPNPNNFITNPYFPAAFQSQFQPNSMVNYINSAAAPSKPKKSKKKKSNESKSKSKKHKKHSKKEKSKKDKSSKQSKSKKSTAAKSTSSTASIQLGNVRSFPYIPDTSNPNRVVRGILSNYARSGPLSSSSNSGVNIDSSSRFVTGYGYPRNVVPEGSYFQAADDDKDFWIRFDFNKRSVQITSYFIDSDNIKNWELQISDDGIEWETVDSHSNYPTQKVKQNFQITPTRFARFCRIHQTGEIWPGSRRSLKLNGIEFYGQVNEN